MATKKYRPYLSIAEMTLICAAVDAYNTSDAVNPSLKQELLASLRLYLLKLQYGYNSPALITNPIEDRLGFSEDLSDEQVNQLMEDAAKKNRAA